MTISLKLDRKSPNSRGEYQIYVRIRDRSSRTGKSTESSVSTDLWIRETFLKEGNLTNRTPGYRSKRRVLDSILSDIESIVGELKYSGQYPHPKLIKQLLSENRDVREIDTSVPSTFWEGWEEWLETKRNTSWGYRKDLQNLRVNLQSYESSSGRKMTYDHIVGKTELFQSNLQHHLWTDRHLSNGYVNKLLKVLSQFLKYSQSVGYIDKKPSFKMNKVISSQEKIYLRTDEVLRLYSSTKWDWKIDKSELFDQKPNIYIIEDPLLGKNRDSIVGTDPQRKGGVLRITNWELVKDKFLFLCSTGMRSQDMEDLKVNSFQFDESNRSFSIIQKKTKNPVRIPENSISNSIFRKYSKGKSLSQNLFPPHSNQVFNRSLKLLMEDLKFDRLVYRPKLVGSVETNSEGVPLYTLISSHSGRRSFVKNLIDLGTMDNTTIMSVTGHKSYKVYQNYISVTSTDTDKTRKLYSEEITKSENVEEELLNTFRSLSDEGKEKVLDMVEWISGSDH